MDRSDVGKSSKPKSKRILLIKTEKNKPWDLELLLWTSTTELMKRDGKLIGASVTRAYSLNGNSIKMRDRLNTMTRNPEKQIVELSKLMRSDTRISTPTNGSTGEEWHNVIEVRGLSVRVHGLLYQRYTNSKGHYSKSNDIFFTPYPTLHKLNIGIIGVDREVWVELSNQSSWRMMLYL